MTQKPSSLRLAAAILLASSAFSPVLAQEVQPPAEPTPEVTPPPVSTEAPRAPAPVEQPAPAAAPVATSSDPVVNTRASGREPASVEAETRPAATRARNAARAAPQRPVRSAARPAPVRAPIVAQPETAAPPPAAEAAPPPPALAETSPAPAPVAEATAPAVTPPVQAADPAPVAQNEGGATSYLPWLIAAALAIGALLLFARRRRRAADDYVAYEEPVVMAEPTPAGYVDEPAPVHMHEPAPAHILDEPAPEAIPVAAAAATAPASNVRPWLDLAIRPVRAGVGEDSARVEFELGVENNGSAPARDVRISAWLLNGNGTDMERMLIDRPAAPEQFEANLEPGDGTRIATAVALPRAGIEDAILPVVAAEARYRLPDGSEGRTAASFAVGVARGEELVMFDVDNPSGMHEGVEARLHGQPSRD
jgi:hypothetical protein